MSKSKGKYKDPFDGHAGNMLREYDECLAKTLEGNPIWEEAKVRYRPALGTRVLANGPLGYPEALMKIPFYLFNQAYRDCQDWDRLVSSMFDLNVRNYYNLFPTEQIFL